MESFPYPLFPLICGSLCISTLTLILSTLIISVSPIFWMFPATFIFTLAYHITILLIANTKKADSLRLFSLPSFIASCAFTCLWIAVTATTITLTVLLGMGRLGKATVPRGMWSMVVPCTCAFLESIVMGAIAAYTRKERKRILYAAKWTWRPGHSTSALSQWSIGLAP